MHPRTLLSFSGFGKDVRLTKVEFWDRTGHHNVSHSGRTPEGASFVWSAAVKAMSLLFITTARSTDDPGGPKPLLSGGPSSPALSLDLAITKGDKVKWLADMFGTLSGGTPRSRVLFHRENSHVRNPSLPVTITIDPKELPHDHISIKRDGLPLRAPELALLQEDIGKSLMYADLDTAVSPPAHTTVVTRRSSHAITFQERYRDIWNDPSARSDEKIAAARALLGTAVPRPYIYLLYSLRVTANSTGDADLEFEVVICNCSPFPLSSHQHEFKFEHPQAVPFGILASDHNRVRMMIDQPHHKFFFIDFPNELSPGEIWGYRFRFSGSRMFRSDHYWDFSVNTITNHILFHLSHDKPGGLSSHNAEILSDMKDAPAPPSPIVNDWRHGATIHWRVPFPHVGNIYRIKWDFNQTT